MKRNRYHDLEGRVRKVLRFERFFAARLREATKAAFVNDVNAAQLGILHLLRDRPAPPGWLSWQLALDPGYVSRTLRSLEMTGLVWMSPSETDGRGRLAHLTERGRAAARYLDHFQEERIRRFLEGFPGRQQERLVKAMEAIIEVFGRDEIVNLLECIEEAS